MRMTASAEALEYLESLGVTMGQPPVAATPPAAIAQTRISVAIPDSTSSPAQAMHIPIAQPVLQAEKSWWKQDSWWLVLLTAATVILFNAVVLLLLMMLKG